jgi:hypothetical protein
MTVKVAADLFAITLDDVRCTNLHDRKCAVVHDFDFVV